MKEFSAMNITKKVQGFIGDKISIDYILNQPIIVHAFKIEPSKFPKKGNDKCLYMQITFNNEKRLFMTSSTGLMDLIQQVAPENFLFKATIVKQDRGLEFR